MPMLKRIGLFIFAFCLFTFYLSCEKDFSPVKIINPPDTTSHNFTWQIDTFGVISSYLLDVAIINETDIWAVGAIQPDPTGVDDIYNAIHWNGQQWELKRIYAVTSFGDTSRGPIRTIFAFSANDIWTFSQAGSYSHWNGIRWKSEYITERVGSINKIWGTSSNNIYFVGTNGNITHYNGSWQRLESGTDVDLTDIWGSPDGSVVWACGWDDFKPTVLLRKQNGNNWELVYNDQDNLFQFRPDSLSGAIFSVWTDKATSLYALTNYTVYKCNPQMPVKCESIWEPANPYTWSSKRLRGRGNNDLVAVGYEGRIWHFNGASWRLYNELINPIDILNSVAVSKDLVVAVGLRYINGIEILGIVYLGKR